jgi:hypothetical protein
MTILDEISNFSRYRMGYEDGYYGKDQRYPFDNDYDMGYKQGIEDDQAAAKNRYDSEMPTPDKAAS